MVVCLEGIEGGGVLLRLNVCVLTDTEICATVLTRGKM